MFGNEVWWKAIILNGAFTVISPDALEVLSLFFNLIKQIAHCHNTQPEDDKGLNV